MCEQVVNKLLVLSVGYVGEPADPEVAVGSDRKVRAVHVIVLSKQVVADQLGVEQQVVRRLGVGGSAEPVELSHPDDNGYRVPPRVKQHVCYPASRNDGVGVSGEDPARLWGLPENFETTTCRAIANLPDCRRRHVVDNTVGQILRQGRARSNGGVVGASMGRDLDRCRADEAAALGVTHRLDDRADSVTDRVRLVMRWDRDDDGREFAHGVSSSWAASDVSPSSARELSTWCWRM